jgi:radical SAM superfamily enzyme YgiQ (UPF0313 family)
LNEKPRVLLASSYVPNEPIMGEDPLNLTSTRWTRSHGAYQLDMYGHYFALYLLAENIKNPTTVLENPSWDEFDRELDEGYGYIGFHLKSLHTAKIARMMKLVREKSPDTKIIIGGNGVIGLGDPVPGDTEGDADYIRENADYICRGEGVKFMREVLGEKDPDREITQYNMPMFSLGGIVGTGGVHIRVPAILVALGCPNGCDFCNTSALYNKNKIYVAEPEEVYRTIKHYQRRMGFKEILYMLWDEDFFQNKEYVYELGRLLRSDKSTWSAKYYTFGSISALSQYEPEEIRDNGCQMIWVGVESFQTGVNATEDRYKKRQGKDVKDVIGGLQKHGVQITGSLAVGFDFHTKKNLKDDIDQFVGLKPTFYQISHVLPCPGTALYDQLHEEDRILDEYKWEDVHFWSSHIFKYKNIDKKDVNELFEYAHAQLRDVNGPPTLQMMESELDSYQTLQGSADKFHRVQAKRNKLFASGFFALIHSIKKHHPSQAVRDRAAMLEARYKNEMGNPSLVNKIISRYISRNIKKKTKEGRQSVMPETPPRWSYYNTYEDGVWVKKGHGQHKPEPYKETGIVAGNKLDGFTSMLKKGKKNLNFLDNI